MDFCCLKAAIILADAPKCPELKVQGRAFINIDVLISHIDDVK
jgi:hypothetical protein